MGEVLVRALPGIVLLNALSLEVATSLIDVRQVHLCLLGLGSSVHHCWLLVRVGPWNVIGLLLVVT